MARKKRVTGPAALPAPQSPVSSTNPGEPTRLTAGACAFGDVPPEEIVRRTWAPVSEQQHERVRELKTPPLTGEALYAKLRTLTADERKRFWSLAATDDDCPLYRALVLLGNLMECSGIDPPQSGIAAWIMEMGKRSGMAYMEQLFAAGVAKEKRHRDPPKRNPTRDAEIVALALANPKFTSGQLHLLIRDRWPGTSRAAVKEVLRRARRDGLLPPK
jgi:hypothetical protein